MNINLDTVAQDIIWVLDNWEIPYNEKIIRAVTVPAWYEAKKHLLELFSQHPNWDPEALAVVFETKYERPLKAGEARRIMLDLLRNGQDTEVDRGNIAKADAIFELRAQLFYKSDLFQSKIDESSQHSWLGLNMGDKDPARVFPKGLRTSKAFARLFKHYGIDKASDYEKLFAQLADAVSPITVDRTVALSFHPCDYLLMSHGTDWDSCHMIDDGCNRGGTWSYMLDGVSAILHSPEDSLLPLFRRRKINRMVVCFKSGQILFSRLYPTHNDHLLRKDFRNIVQEAYALCLDIPNLWQKPLTFGGDDGKNYSPFVFSASRCMQYPDYAFGYSCELSVAKNKSPIRMTIGAPGICPVSGETYDNSELMTKTVYIKCSHCGSYHTEDRSRWIGGAYYCDDCYDDLFVVCSSCYDVVRKDDALDSVDGPICEKCAEDHYVMCDICDTYERISSATEAFDSATYCHSCADEADLTCCDDCGEYYPGSDIAIYHGRHLCPDCLEEIQAQQAEESEVAVNA